MMNTNRHWTLPLALLFLVISCSDDELKPDSAAAQDLSADQSAPDKGGQPDTATADKAGQPDKTKKPDQAKQPDLGQTDTTSHDVLKPACAGVKCVLKDDCCICRGFKSGSTVPVCPTTTCKQNTCGALLLKKPSTYCLKGRCLVADYGTPCTADSQCKRVDTCCDCISIPSKAISPSCPIKSCFVNTCTSYGLGTAKARCVNGFCVLSLK